MVCVKDKTSAPSCFPCLQDDDDVDCADFYNMPTNDGTVMSTLWFFPGASMYDVKRFASARFAWVVR